MLPRESENAMNGSPMQVPSGGCYVCGGPVRTWKRDHGWTCAKCVREGDREATAANRARRAVGVRG
jgi:reverse gyrase